MKTKRINVKHIMKVAAAIEKAAQPEAKPEIGFNMLGFFGHFHAHEDRTGHKCATTACIAGWSVFVRRGITVSPDGVVEADAREYLGIGDKQEQQLFYGNYNANPLQAVRALRHLALTGEVKWRM